MSVSQSDVFVNYESRVFEISENIAEELEEKNSYESLEGREWCEERGVPEYAFAHAVEWYLTGVDWGVSPLYPFRSEDEVTVADFEETEDTDTQTEDVEEEDSDDE